MRLSLDDAPVGNQISHYETGKVTVNKRDFKDNLVICANKLLCPWTAKTVAELTLDDFSPILNCKPSIIILGTGERLEMPDQAIMAALQSRGIGIEVMDTPAACRTYNVLISEGRDVVAGLLVR